MNKILLATLLVASANCMAQTVTDAYQFIDETLGNPSTRIGAQKERSKFTAEDNAVSGIRSTACKTLFAIPQGYNNGWLNEGVIDWSQVVDVRHFFENKDTPGLAITGGATVQSKNHDGSPFGSAGKEGKYGFVIDVGSIDRENRLVKAINLVLQECRKPSKF